MGELPTADQYLEEVKRNPTSALRNYQNALNARIKVSNQILKQEKKCKDVLELIVKYGGIEGPHNKQWVLDQIVRIIEGDNYENWLAKYQEGEDGSHTCTWDQGKAP